MFSLKYLSQDQNYTMFRPKKLCKMYSSLLLRKISQLFGEIKIFQICVLCTRATGGRMGGKN